MLEIIIAYGVRARWRPPRGGLGGPGTGAAALRPQRLPAGVSPAARVAFYGRITDGG